MWQAPLKRDHLTGSACLVCAQNVQTRNDACPIRPERRVDQNGAVRAFSSSFSITQCDAVYRRSLIVAHRLEAVRPALACGLAVRQA